MTNKTQNFTTFDIYSDSIFTPSRMIVFTIVVGVGSVGNIITIAAIIFRESLHTATHTAIALLAFVDLVALCLRGFWTLVYTPYIYFNYKNSIDTFPYEMERRNPVGFHT